jgi:replicative DNA helicase
MNDIATQGVTPPSEVQAAELAVAGACLTRIDCVEAAASILKADGSDFANLPAGMVFAAAVRIAGAGVASISPALVLKEMHRSGTAQFVQGDMNRLWALMGLAAVGVDNTLYEAQLVADDANRRAVFHACWDGAQRSASPGFDLRLDLDAIIGAVTAIGTSARAEDRNLYARDHLAKMVDQMRNPDRSAVLPSPWPDLDRVVKMKGGKFILVGARPGGGKSLVGAKIASYASIECQPPYPVVLFSMEMPGEDVMMRIAADLAGVSINKLDEGGLDDFEWNRIEKFIPAVENAPLVIDDTERLTISHVRTRLRWMVSEGIAPRYVVLDYVQLMQLDPSWGDAGWEKLGGLSRELKILAGEFNVVVIGLVQLNRESEGRPGKVPQTSDLRGSGSLEQDADAVILLYQEPHESDPKELARPGEVDLMVEKNRNGPKSRITLTWQPHYGRVANMGG